MAKKPLKNKIIESKRKKRFKTKKHLSFNIIVYSKIIKLFFIFSLFIIGLFIHIKGKIINRIHIAISVDNNYIYPCIVYLTSLLNNRGKSTFYNIHILTNNNITKESMNKMNKIIDQFGKNSAVLEYYNLEGDFKGATTKNFPLINYYRISLPSILPNVDKIIYSDLDTINLEDLTEMYNIELKDNIYFCGTLDFTFMINEIKKLGIKTNKYINAGIMLISLKAIRNDGIERKMREFISSHYLPCADQTAINAVCSNNIQILPYKYSIFAYDSFEKLIDLNNHQDSSYRFNESELNQSFNEPTFLHYYGRHKPWNNYKPRFNRVYWWYYAKMSGFYQEILDFYKFNINDIEELLKQIPADGGLLKRNYKKLS